MSLLLAAAPTTAPFPVGPGPALDFDPEPDPDTVRMPVIGDRVRYCRGSGHLVGLEGVVVSADDGHDLPLGLRYVLVDDEAWPIAVTVDCLERTGTRQDHSERTRQDRIDRSYRANR